MRLAESRPALDLGSVIQAMIATVANERVGPINACGVRRGEHRAAAGALNSETLLSGELQTGATERTFECQRGPSQRALDPDRALAVPVAAGRVR